MVDVDALRQLLGPGDTSVVLGTVTALEVPNPTPGAALAAPLVIGTVQPGGELFEARVAFLGAGPGSGIYPPKLLVGQEVLVLLPGGDPNRAVVLGALHNLANPMGPAALARLGNLFQAPGGNELRSAEGLTAEGMVLGATFFAQLAAYLVAMDAFMAALAVTPSLPMADAKAAAIAFQAAVGAPSTLGANAAASAAAGGAPPFCSPLNRVTL